jgi:hypothetical protein
VRTAPVVPPGLRDALVENWYEGLNSGEGKSPSGWKGVQGSQEIYTVSWADYDDFLLK